MKKIILPLAMMALCSGCANFSPLTANRQINGPGTHWLTYDSSRRGTLIVQDSSGKVISCAEPAPDTTYSFSNSFKGNVSSGGTTVGAEAAIAATALALAGRDNLVLLARESMFRLCEARANGFVTNDQYNAQFGQVLVQIIEIARAAEASSKEAIGLLTQIN